MESFHLRKPPQSSEAVGETFADPCVMLTAGGSRSTCRRHLSAKVLSLAVVQRPPEGLIRTEPTVYTDGSAESIDRQRDASRIERVTLDGGVCVCVVYVCVRCVCVCVSGGRV